MLQDMKQMSNKQQHKEKLEMPAPILLRTKTATLQQEKCIKLSLWQMPEINNHPSIHPSILC